MTTSIAVYAPLRIRFVTFDAMRGARAAFRTRFRRRFLEDVICSAPALCYTSPKRSRPGPPVEIEWEKTR